VLRRNEFLDYLDRFRDARVLVIGPAVAEVDTRCAVTHVAPDRAMPVYRRLSETSHPGAAALTAATITNLGGQAVLLAPIGHGESGCALRRVLDEIGVHLIECGNGTAQTPELVRYLSSDDRQLLQIRKRWNPETFVDLPGTLEKLTTTSFDCICIVDGLPTSLTNTDVQHILKFAQSHGIPVIFDAAGGGLIPPGSNDDNQSRVDHLIVNKTESLAMLPAEKRTDDAVERVQHLLHTLADSVINTLGRQGLIVGTTDITSPDNQGNEHRITPMSVPVRTSISDRRGVGFVFSGAYALAIAAGAGSEDAAFLAAGAAGAAVSTPGPKNITIDDLTQIAYREIESQIIDGIEVFSRITRHHLPDIDRAARLLLQAYTEHKQVLVFGNGGSAAEANHLVTELTGRFRAKRPSLPSISLSSNDALTTCIANDYGYDNVFAHQIDAFCRPGDVVLGMSTSGRSVNVVRAMEQARQCKARIIAFTGEQSGPMNELADVSVAVPSLSTPRIQEAHLFVIHVMCEMLDRRLDEQGRLQPSAPEI